MVVHLMIRGVLRDCVLGDSGDETWDLSDFLDRLIDKLSLKRCRSLVTNPRS